MASILPKRFKDKYNRLTIYRYLFARSIFRKFNEKLFHMSLRGMGILNYQNSKVSGEDFFIKLLGIQDEHLVVFDVGANIGIYSQSVKDYYSNSEVYAFEPHPNTFKRLQSNVHNSDIKIFNLAVNDTVEKRKLYDKLAVGTGHASLYQEVAHKGNKELEALAWDVETTTIDLFIEENAIETVHLLKIDTEGNELKVLKGAKKSLESGKIEVVQFEFNEMNVVSRVFFKDFLSILPDFDFYRLLPQGFFALDSYNPLLCEIYAYQDIIAVSRKSNFCSKARKYSDRA